MVASSYCNSYAGQLQWILTVPVDGVVHVYHDDAGSLPNYSATGPSVTTLMIRELLQQPGANPQAATLKVAVAAFEVERDVVFDNQVEDDMHGLMVEDDIARFDGW